MAAKKMRLIVRLFKAAVALISRLLKRFFVSNRDQRLLAIVLLDFEIVGAEVLEFSEEVKSYPYKKLAIKK